MFSVAAVLPLAAGEQFAAAASNDIIPRPKLVQESDGTFALSRDTPLVADSSPATDDAANLLNRQLGLSVSKSAATMPAHSILLTTSGADPSLGAEGYRLDVAPTGVTIRASQSAGLFYGAVSLLELLPPENIQAE